MRASQFTHTGRLLAATAAGFVLLVPAASAAPPAPCGGIPQISDTADGHHPNTNVLSAWLTQSGGPLQAVVQVETGDWAPAHDDSESAGVALLYQLAGQTRYVRVQMFRGAPPAYDHGTWSAGGFASEGATTGAVTTGPQGTVTIDVPAVPVGAVLARPYVLTYDGSTDHVVDRAPGGETAAGTEFGADYVAGPCPASNPTPAATTSAVALKAPRKLTGSGRVNVTGRVAPARAGVTVEITASARRSTTQRVTTAADGSFSLSLPVSETTRVRAVAEGIGSQTLTVQMYSKVRIKVRRLRSGAVVVTGTTSPKLSGRVLWLRSNAVRPSKRVTARDGRFRFTLKNPRDGRYQAVFIPNGDRAERSTSNTGVIR